MKKTVWLVPLLLSLSLACNALAVPASAPSAGAATLAPSPTETPLPTLAAPSETPAPTATPLPEATPIPAGVRAREHLVALAEGIGPRIAGTEAERAARDYIFAAFQAAGYQPELQEFSTTDEDDDGNTLSIRSANVIAVKPGLSKREILVGAHYDSTGEAGRGADDNASAVSVLLEVAEKIQPLETPYTIRFITFGAEEIDLNGSSAYAGQMSRAEIDNTLAMINLDSLAAGDNPYLYSAEGPKAKVRDWALAWASQHGFDLQTVPNVDLTDEGDGTSDHFAFQQIGIPYAYFEATNWTLGDRNGYTQVDPQFGESGEIWHTQYDNLEYLDKTFPGRVDAHLNLFVSVLQAILTEYP
jgi:alkaline phosphatase isozyme conversion protein